MKDVQKRVIKKLEHYHNTLRKYIENENIVYDTDNYEQWEVPPESRTIFYAPTEADEQDEDDYAMKMQSAKHKEGKEAFNELFATFDKTDISQQSGGADGDDSDSIPKNIGSNFIFSPTQIIAYYEDIVKTLHLKFPKTWYDDYYGKALNFWWNYKTEVQLFYLLRLALPILSVSDSQIAVEGTFKANKYLFGKLRNKSSEQLINSENLIYHYCKSNDPPSDETMKKLYVTKPAAKEDNEKISGSQATSSSLSGKKRKRDEMMVLTHELTQLSVTPPHKRQRMQ